ncbi:MAG: NAD(P)-dependent oxidoreductase, partial [Burkholderia sp.]|nr:NAD(P)-dependent oxidoreductase [Burkholderia sp.]
MALGFAGLGLMGEPMALRLCRSGHPITVYNRSRRPLDTLRTHGARIAHSPHALFGLCDTVILMLADDVASDAVIGRSRPEFGRRVEGRLI